MLVQCDFLEAFLPYLKHYTLKDILIKNFDTHVRKESTVFVTLESEIILSGLQRCIIVPCVACCDALITEECFHIYVEKMLFVQMHNVSQIKNYL